MIDIHCHLLNNVDDGAKTLEETLEGLKLAQKSGFTDIILTPHYIDYYYNNDNNLIEKKIEELKKEIVKNNILINIHQGNEIYFCDDLAKLLNMNNAPSTLAGSRYVLFELPFNTSISTSRKIFICTRKPKCVKRPYFKRCVNAK